MSIDDTIDGREGCYGAFKYNASISQRIKATMHATTTWSRLNYSQQEALEMIAHKMGRIINGDPTYVDNWHDIAGYATLIERELNE